MSLGLRVFEDLHNHNYRGPPHTQGTESLTHSVNQSSEQKIIIIAGVQSLCLQN
jgi:hypothetical protein